MKYEKEFQLHCLCTKVFCFEERVQITIHLKFFKRTIYFENPRESCGKESGCGVKKCLRLFYDYFPFIIAVGFLAYTIFRVLYARKLFLC